MKNLTKAVIAVMKAVKGMEKNSKVGTGKSSYNGTKDQDVKEVFNEALAKNGLIMLPIDIEEHTEIERWQESTQYGDKMKQSVFTKVKTKYLLAHESGEQIELVGYGHGVDTQDKSAGKATTYALKNCLLYSFLTPVGKIDDTDTIHSDDIETPNAKPKQSKPAVKKESLKADSVPFKNAVEKLAGKEVTLGKIKEYYNLAADVEQELLKQAALYGKK